MTMNTPTQDKLSGDPATRKRINLAITAISKGRPKVVSKSRKLTVSSVAEEAGVTRASIYKDYRDLLAKIEGKVDKNIRRQRDEKTSEIKELKEKNKALREELMLEREKNRKLASLNARLTYENKELLAIKHSPNVVPLK